MKYAPKTIEQLQAMTDKQLAIELQKQIELLDSEEVFWEEGMLVIRESQRRLEERDRIASRPGIHATIDQMESQGVNVKPFREMIKQLETMGDIKTRKIQELAECVVGLLSAIKSFQGQVSSVAPDAEFILNDKRI